MLWAGGGGRKGSWSNWGKKKYEPPMVGGDSRLTDSYLFLRRSMLRRRDKQKDCHSRSAIQNTGKVGVFNPLLI